MVEGWDTGVAGSPARRRGFCCQGHPKPPSLSQWGFPLDLFAEVVVGAAPRYREALPEVHYLKQAGPNVRARAKPWMVLTPIRHEGVTPIGRDDLPSKDFHHALTPFQVTCGGLLPPVYL